MKVSKVEIVEIPGKLGYNLQYDCVDEEQKHMETTALYIEGNIHLAQNLVKFIHKYAKDHNG